MRRVLDEELLSLSWWWWWKRWKEKGSRFFLRFLLLRFARRRCLSRFAIQDFSHLLSLTSSRIASIWSSVKRMLGFTCSTNEESSSWR